jgi:glycosyltransferase 2 family protein
VTEPPVQPRRRNPFLNWKGLLGAAVSLLFLWYAFRGIDIGEVAREIGRARPALLALASFLITLPFVFRAVRWGILLRPLYAATRFRPRFAATCIGFMANNLLPARIGEFARAYAMSRLEPIRMSGSFGSLLVERMFDAVMVIGLLIVALTWPGFPDASGGGYASAARVLGLLLVVGFALLLLMVSRPAASARLFERVAGRILPGRLRRPVFDAMVAFLAGTAAIRDWRLVVRTLAWSAVVWLTAGLATWVGFLAFGIQAPFIAAVFLQSIIALAVSLPSAPGFFGIYQAAARVGLVDVWGVATTPAMAFAIGFHLAGYIPVTVMGLLFLWRLDFSWSDVEHSEEVVETAVEQAEGVGPGASSAASTPEGIEP